MNKHFRALSCGLIFALFSASTATIAQEMRPLTKGQTLYLPIYSHMLYGNIGKSGKASNAMLSALVSIRNTEGKRPLRGKDRKQAMAQRALSDIDAWLNPRQEAAE